MDEQLKQFLESQDYTDLREIPQKGVCGIQMFAFTFGLIYGMDRLGYIGRYCYPTYMEARIALELWDGTGHPKGEWIKHKGDTEFSKKQLEEFEKSL